MYVVWDIIVLLILWNSFHIIFYIFPNIPSYYAYSSLQFASLFFFVLFQSTLLQCLLGELHPVRGTVDVKGKIAYVSQDPWLFAGTLRDNILFGSPFYVDWYDAVLDACALHQVWKDKSTLVTQTCMLMILYAPGHWAAPKWGSDHCRWKGRNFEWRTEGKGEPSQGHLCGLRCVLVGWPTQCSGCSCSQTYIWKVLDYKNRSPIPKSRFFQMYMWSPERSSCGISNTSAAVCRTGT